MATVTTLYTTKQLACFSLYSDQFNFDLTSRQSGRPSLADDTVWYGNRIKFTVEVDSAKQAVAMAQDQKSGQECLDRATYMRENKSLFF